MSMIDRVITSYSIHYTKLYDAVGDKISFAIELQDGTKTVWTCEGVVVRVEPHGGSVGVAVRITGTTVESS